MNDVSGEHAGGPPETEQTEDDGNGEVGFGWGGALHTSFRLLPEPSGHLRPFLTSDGLTREDVLDKLPYDRARAGENAGTRPSKKRYRDPRLVYQSAGLLYDVNAEDTKRVVLTDFGRVVLRWLDLLNHSNAPILGRHAAYALAACQLRNPLSRTGKSFGDEVEVFPFAFIWRAMLALDNKINSEELNRVIFRVQSEDGLERAIGEIDRFRSSKTTDWEDLDKPTLTGRSANDRIIPWMSLASFGWTLFLDKRRGEADGYYEIPSSMVRTLSEAARIRHSHRSFSSRGAYVEYIARAAALPQDMR